MAGNYPAPREIPPGKVLIAEYGEQNAERAVVELIAEKEPRADFPGRRAILGGIWLIWSSPGFEFAGSCMTWTNGYWAVRWRRRDNTYHGQRYRLDDGGETKAREHFRRLTEASQ